ncbi:UDP-glucuronosyl/UDP-glucosyltransferase [Dillenia turbinata]|uniref:Glycosyltransferase n=1 Tax=Dillenia turbinata TaxID=194707 RepID=A0AAN8WCZ6_9MAGN
MATTKPAPHIVIFPFMSQGHTLPLLDIAKELSRRGLQVTIITTPSNAESIQPDMAKHSRISFTLLSFPSIEGLPLGCENTLKLPSRNFMVPFLTSTKVLKQQFRQVLKQMINEGSKPICVISDFFLGWTMDVCLEFGIPRMVFNGTAALSMAITRSLDITKLQETVTSDAEPIHFAGKELPFTVTKSDFPGFDLIINDSPMSKLLAESGEAEAKSWGVLMNTFVELEASHLTLLETIFKNGAKGWPVGPLLLYNEESQSNDNISSSTKACLAWLDSFIKKPASVLYASFGSQAFLSDKDLDEIGYGLEMSGHHFLWLVSSRTWSPLEGLEERVRGRGMIMRDWIEQRKVLSHSAIGGFLSHCGWNSVLESLSAGVPILALAVSAEQPLNVKQVVHEMKMGLRIENCGPRGPEKVEIRREAISEGVVELMGGEKGEEVRARAAELRKLAKDAVKEGGSSYNKLTELIDILKAM